jgi:hypothetical protein
MRPTTGDGRQGLVSADAMGQLELFAQRTFAEETERTTSGAAGWQDPSEIRLEKVTADGFLVVRRPQLLAQLPAPWPEAQAHSEVMIELKLAGNHLDREAVVRAVIRRHAREVQRLKEEDASWRGHEPLWLIAPHFPQWLDEVYAPVRGAPGCYWVEPQWQRFLWIAANELPLVDELIPFLLARSGQALDEFCRWVAPRRPLDWVLSMLDYLPMSMPTHEELLWRFGKAEDPAIEARRQRLLDFLLETSPEKKLLLRQEGQQEGRLTATRASLRLVLANRQFTPSKDDDARIDACTDLATLERWLGRAITAASVSDVLR